MSSESGDSEESGTAWPCFSDDDESFLSAEKSCESDADENSICTNDIPGPPANSICSDISSNSNTSRSSSNSSTTFSTDTTKSSNSTSSSITSEHINPNGESPYRINRFDMYARKNLKTLIRNRLISSGWQSTVREMCREELLAKGKDADMDQFFRTIVPQAMKIVPAGIDQDIREFTLAAAAKRASRKRKSRKH